MGKKDEEYSHPDETYIISKEQMRKSKRYCQIEVMKDWFFRHFQNPAESTPFESAEGGYIYIWGGPYDAHEVLENEFGGVVSQKAIDNLDVSTYLLDLIWHNLSKLKEMDKAALDIEFLGSMQTLYSAITKRQDIVHRNGRDKEGNKVHNSEQDIRDILSAIRQLADHIDAHFKPKIREEML